jgi:SAM-dependent methyltransferase
MEEKSSSALFDAYYYAHDCGRPYQRSQDWLGLFDGIAKRIVSDIQPGKVLDAGCAMGFMVEFLRKHGVDAWGIDISEYAIQKVHPDIQPYCQVGSILEAFSQPHYDLIVCIEVLEHLKPPETEQAIANLCQHTDDILFSSTPYDYQEATHFNVRPPEYWAESFARHGFLRDVDFDASFITPWAMRLVRKDVPLVRLVHDYERRFVPLWKENADLRFQATQTRLQMEAYEKRQLELEQEIQAAKDTLQQQELLLSQKDTELSEVRRRLDEILNSRIWRIFKPLP